MIESYLDVPHHMRKKKDWGEQLRKPAGAGWTSSRKSMTASSSDTSGGQPSRHLTNRAAERDTAGGSEASPSWIRSCDSCYVLIISNLSPKERYIKSMINIF